MSVQVKLEGDINQGVAYYKKALYYNWHYADAMYNLGVAYGEMLKFDMVSNYLRFICLEVHNFLWETEFLFVINGESFMHAYFIGSFCIVCIR